MDRTDMDKIGAMFYESFIQADQSFGQIGNVIMDSYAADQETIGILITGLTGKTMDKLIADAKIMDVSAERRKLNI